MDFPFGGFTMVMAIYFFPFPLKLVILPPPLEVNPLPVKAGVVTKPLFDPALLFIDGLVLGHG